MSELKLIPLDYHRHWLLGTTYAGLVGAFARIRSQSPERRLEIARLAAAARGPDSFRRQWETRRRNMAKKLAETS